MKWTWRRKKRDEELNEEIRAHLEMAVREREERGESGDDARATARREFGNATLVRETTRDMWGRASLERLWQDARYGLRMMRRSPGFTIVAVLTLALGIGGTTAMFSVFDAVVLRPLPVRDQGQLVLFKWHALRLPDGRYSTHGDCAADANRQRFHEGCSFSTPMFEQFRAGGVDVFSGVAAYTDESSLLLTGNGPAHRVSGQLVSGDFFPMLGVRPVLGRLLSPSDDLASAAPAVALSYGYWQSEFGGSLSVIGQTMKLNNIPFTIVGIAEPRFADLTPGNEKSLWITFAQYPRLNVPGRHDTGSQRDWWVVVVGRLREDVSLVQGQSVVNALFRNAMLNGSGPLLKPTDEPSSRLSLAQEGLNGFRQQALSPIYSLIFAAGIVLLIACANVAGLSLAGTAARRKEIAVRLALGAARGRIARQLLTESILLSVIGSAIGIFVAYWGVRGIRASLSAAGTNILGFPVHPDFRVLSFAVGISILTGILIGLAPIFQSREIDLTPTLKENASPFARIVRGRRKRIALSDVLIGAQVALAMLLLAEAGLLVRTIFNLDRVDPRVRHRKHAALQRGSDPGRLQEWANSNTEW